MQRGSLPCLTRVHVPNPDLMNSRNLKLSGKTLLCQAYHGAPGTCCGRMRDSNYSCCGKNSTCHAITDSFKWNCLLPPSDRPKYSGFYSPVTVWILSILGTLLPLIFCAICCYMICNRSPQVNINRVYICRYLYILIVYLIRFFYSEGPQPLYRLQRLHHRTPAQVMATRLGCIAYSTKNNQLHEYVVCARLM